MLINIGSMLLSTVTCAFLITMIATHISPNLVYAQLTDNRTQQWIDQRDNLKIQFTYEPEKPQIGSPTELKFSVQNLQTGQHLKDLFAKITIINGQRVFKFNNLTVSDGDFSVNSTFPNEGTYQVILRINSKDYAIALASFRVFVPFQPLGTINLNHTIPLLLPAALAGIIGVIMIATFLIIMKREYKKRYGSEE
jgi:hypothetical protein